MIQSPAALSEGRPPSPGKKQRKLSDLAATQAQLTAGSMTTRQATLEVPEPEPEPEPAAQALNAAAQIEKLRSGNQELCGLLIHRDETIAELTENNVRLQAQCAQLIADQAADQSLMSAFESRAVRAEEQCNVLRTQIGQLRHEMSVNRRVVAASARKLQHNSLLRCFNTWTGFVGHLVAARNAGTRAINCLRNHKLAATLSSWRENTIDSIATRQLLLKCMQRIRNRTMLQAFSQWLLRHETQIRTRDTNQRIVATFVRKMQMAGLLRSFNALARFCRQNAATKKLLLKAVDRIRTSAVSKAFTCWIMWQEAQVRDREIRRVSVEHEDRVHKLTASQQQAEKHKMRLVVQRLRVRALARAMSAWRSHMLQMAVVNNTSLREGLIEAQEALRSEVAEFEAAQKAAARSTSEQKMRIIVQKLRLSALARAMSAWRSDVLDEQVDAANTRLLEGLIEAKDALRSGLAEAEAAAETSLAALAAEVNALRESNLELGRHHSSLTADNHELSEFNQRLEESAAEAKRQLAVVLEEMSSVRTELAASKTQQQEMILAMNKMSEELDASLERERQVSEETAQLRSEVKEIEELLVQPSIQTVMPRNS